MVQAPAGPSYTFNFWQKFRQSGHYSRRKTSVKTKMSTLMQTETLAKDVLPMEKPTHFSRKWRLLTYTQQPAI
jgi:hypothetical protein